MARQLGDHLDRGLPYQGTLVRSETLHGVWLAIGRALFGGFFLFNGIHHLMTTSLLAAYAGNKGVPSPELAVLGTGLMLIAGGASVILGVWPRVGAALIMLFLLGVTPVMHDFWNATDPQARMADFGNFTKNIGLFGGACFAFALPAPWPASLHLQRRAAEA